MNNTKAFWPIVATLLFLVSFIPSCSRVIDGGPMHKMTENMNELFVFDPSTGHYKLSGGSGIVTKTYGSNDELLDILDRNNAFLDSIINVTLSNGAEFVYLFDGESGTMVKVIPIGDDAFRIAPLTRDDSLVFDPGTDSLALDDTLAVPHITSPCGKLFSGSSNRVFAPFFMRGFNCSLFASAPAAFHVVRTVFLDTTPVVGTAVGISASLYVPVAASNIYGTISYNCTCSNSPFCMYSGHPYENPNN